MRSGRGGGGVGGMAACAVLMFLGSGCGDGLATGSITLHEEAAAAEGSDAREGPGVSAVTQRTSSQNEGSASADASSATACRQTTQRWGPTSPEGTYLGRTLEEFDAEGRLLKERDFDEADRPLSESSYFFGPNGALESQTAKYFSDGHLRLTSDSVYVYDEAGRLLTRTTAHQSPDPTVEPHGTRLSRSYDSAGRLLREWEEEYADASMGYQLTWSNTYSYDSLGRLSSIESNHQRKRVATYDADGRLAKVESFQGDHHVGTHVYSYPSEGGWSVQGSGAGASTTWSYDAEGRLVMTTWSDASGSGGESFTFDGQGQLRSHEKWDDTARGPGRITQTHLYDASGRRVATETREKGSVHPDASGARDERRLTVQVYDPLGQFRLQEERITRSVTTTATGETESAPRNFLRQRTWAEGYPCRLPPDAPPPEDPELLRPSTALPQL